MGVQVQIKPGIDGELAESTLLREHALKAAEKIAEKARELAPVGTEAEGDLHPGQYRDSITAEASGKGAVVLSKDPLAHFVEFGVPHYFIPPKFVFRHAAQACGYNLKSSNGG